MKRLSLLPTMLAASLLIGCTDLPTKLSAANGGVGDAKLVLETRISNGGYSLASIVASYSQSNIEHLQLQLFKLSGNSETAVTDSNGAPLVLDLINSELDSPITIDHLHANTTYRIRAYAYKAMGTAASDLISTDDANSYVDVVLTNDDRPTVSTLKVKLKDVPFSGKGTYNGVTVTAGGYAPIGTETFGLQASGSIATPPSTGSLAIDIGYCTPVRIGNYLYIPGGQTSNQVQVASLQADGSLSSFSVVNGVTLATVLRAYTTAVIGNYLYVFGGHTLSGDIKRNTVQCAAINPDGTIGTFSDAGVTLTTARSAAGLYVGGGYVYVFGGTNSSNVHQSSVERAAINPDGTLGAFALVDGLTLTKARTQFATVTYGSKVYVIGGAQGSNDNTVESATINPDGTLGSFAAEGSMTIKRGSPAAAVIGGKLYVFAGFSSNGPVDSIESALINEDGTLGAFGTVAGVTTAEANYGEGGLVAGNSFYMFHSSLSQRFLLQ